MLCSFRFQLLQKTRFQSSPILEDLRGDAGTQSTTSRFDSATPDSLTYEPIVPAAN